MNSTLRGKKLRDVKLRSKICTNGFDLSLKLSFNQMKEVLNMSRGLRLRIKQIHPSATTKVINNGEEEMSTMAVLSCK